MMRKEDWLGSLGVGIARHHGVDMLLCPGDQRRFEGIGRVEELEARALYVEPEVNRHLVVAAPAGVQLAPQRPELLSQAGLDGHVDVFCSPHPALPRVRGRGHFLFDFLEGQIDAQLLFRRQDPGPNQRLRIGATASDVLTKEPAVNRQRARKAVDQRVRLFAKPPAPGLIAQFATFAFRLASTSQGKPPICAAGPHNCWLKLRLCRPRISGKKSE